jgi:mRNA interferase MazF
MKGKIVVVPFPFTDLSSIKRRPALVIHETKYDIVVAYISSNMPSIHSPEDVLISRCGSSFALSGEDEIAIVSEELIGSIRPLIEQAKAHVAQLVNSELISYDQANRYLWRREDSADTVCTALKSGTLERANAAPEDAGHALRAYRHLPEARGAGQTGAGGLAGRGPLHEAIRLARGQVEAREEE